MRNLRNLEISARQPSFADIEDLAELVNEFRMEVDDEVVLLLFSYLAADGSLYYKYSEVTIDTAGNGPFKAVRPKAYKNPDADRHCFSSF